MIRILVAIGAATFFISNSAQAFVPSEKYLIQQLSKQRAQIKLVTLYSRVQAVKGLPFGAVDEEWTLDLVKRKSTVQYLRSGTRQVLLSKVSTSFSDLSPVAQAWVILGVWANSDRVTELLNNWISSEHKTSLSKVEMRPLIQIGTGESFLTLDKKTLRPYQIKNPESSLVFKTFSSDTAAVAFPKQTIVESGDVQVQFELSDFKVGRGYQAGEVPAEPADGFLVDSLKKLQQITR